MKIVLLCGNQPNQVALANKIAAQFELAGIVVEKKLPKKTGRFSVKQITWKLLDRIFFFTIHNAWIKLMDFYKTRYPDFPNVTIVKVADVNGKIVVDFLIAEKPDLLMVSGTSIIKTKILELYFPKGIINLHTGLSPYINGGPNCTNWCIATNQIHLIGNTVMWIDAGIDSGDIIGTQIIKLTGKERLSEIHQVVMEHAHDLYLETVKKIAYDYSNCAKVKQAAISKGITYYSRQWNWQAKISLLKNIKRLSQYCKSNEYKNALKQVVTIPLQ